MRPGSAHARRSRTASPAAPIADAQLAVKDAAGDLDLTKLEVTVTASSWTTPGSQIVVTSKYPYEVNLLGWVVASGKLTSTMKERLE